MWHHHKKSDLKGDLHVHTAKEVCDTHLGLMIEEYEEACGHLPLNEVINEARDNAGMSYIGITNHTSHPIDPAPNREEANERVRRSTEAIREYCKRERGIKIFAGAEVNILPDGQLDVDDEALNQLDYAVASMHFLEDIDAETIQVNYLQALQHPHVHIHNVDSKGWNAVVKAAAHFGCALEFNVGAQLPDELIRLVVRHKAVVTIGSDAHWNDSTQNYVHKLIGPKMDETYLLDSLRRLSKIPKKYIANFWEPEEVASWLGVS